MIVVDSVIEVLLTLTDRIQLLFHRGQLRRFRRVRADSLLQSPLFYASLSLIHVTGVPRRLTRRDKLGNLHLARVRAQLLDFPNSYF